MTAPTTPPPSPLDRLKQLRATAELPSTVAIDDVDVATAIEPAIRILEILEQRPEIRPAPWLRGRVGHLSDVVNDVARQLRAIAGDSRYAGAFEIRTLVDRFTWCGEQLKLLSVESWHERPAPRHPIGVTGDTPSYPGVVVVCDDGSVWWEGVGTERTPAGWPWQQLPPIPDSSEDRRRRDAAVAAAEVAP